MNKKTAVLLRKAADVMASIKMKETRKPVNNKRVYSDLKRQWKATPWNKRNKIRRSLQHMIRMAESKYKK